MQDGELGVEVAGEEGEERDYGEDDGGDEGVCDGGEGGCEAGLLVSMAYVDFVLLDGSDIHQSNGYFEHVVA